MKYSPDHLVAVHSPRHRPAATRHHRIPRPGPKVSRLAPPATRSASRARATSRSISRHPNPASAQNITKMSSRPVRLCTKWWPSTASSRPAVAPSSVEPNSRRAIRASMRIDSVPTTAEENATRAGAPDRLSTAIIRASGGWTTKSALLMKTSGWPWANGRPASATRVRCCSSAARNRPEQREAYFDVVDFVEQRVRPVEPPEPRNGADQGDRQARHPAPQPLARPGPEQPGAHGGRLLDRAGPAHFTRFRPGLFVAAPTGLGGPSRAGDRGHPRIVRAPCRPSSRRQRPPEGRSRSTVRG